MARTSSRQRKSRRDKRNMSQLVKQHRQYQQDNFRLYSTLLMVLAQKGDVIVTQGTAQQVIDNLPQLSYEIVMAKDGKEFTIRMVVKSPPVFAAPGEPEIMRGQPGVDALGENHETGEVDSVTEHYRDHPDSDLRVYGPTIVELDPVVESGQCPDTVDRPRDSQ